MSPKDKDIVKAKVISIEEEKALIERPHGTPQIATPPSSIPFGNAISRRRIDSYTEVVKAEERLMKSIKSHQMTMDDLRTVGDDMAGARADKKLRREIAEEGLESYRKRRGQRIQTEIVEDLELQVAEQELRNKLKELEEGKPKEKSKIEKYAEDLDEEIKKEEILLDKNRKRRERFKQRMEEEKLDERDKFLGGRRIVDLSEEELAELDHRLAVIEDRYNKFDI